MNKILIDASFDQFISAVKNRCRLSLLWAILDKNMNEHDGDRRFIIYMYLHSCHN